MSIYVKLFMYYRVRFIFCICFDFYLQLNQGIIQNAVSYSVIALLEVYPKNAFCKIYVTIYGRFCLNEGGVAGYVNRMKAKHTVKWGM